MNPTALAENEMFLEQSKCIDNCLARAQEIDIYWLDPGLTSSVLGGFDHPRLPTAVLKQCCIPLLSRGEELLILQGRAAKLPRTMYVGVHDLL